ncbi:MAG TPA: hypothetical protein VK176_11600 [Phycisphaerales bacterium]|nr:hypothetical protein [Phycisphaerales bacterium]
MKRGRAEDWMTASMVLDAVEEWATSMVGDYWLIRETVASVEGRIDGLLVPASYQAHVFKSRTGYWTDKAAVIGVEVKASRADFLAGARKDQFRRYAKNLAGLYVATPRSVKTSELPDGVGHLVAYRPDKEGFGLATLRVVCKRHPTYASVEMDPDLMWRLVFQAISRMRAESRRGQDQWRKTCERVGQVLERRLFAVMDAVADAVAKEGDR